VGGTIHYPDGTEGRLLYIKSALTGTEPQDILAYKVANPSFPHQSTGDQWFNESQFESYRALGRFAIEDSFRPLGEPQPGVSMSLREVFDGLFPVGSPS
jgi:hypothetical protein